MQCLYILKHLTVSGKKKKIKCLFQTNIPPAVYEAYEEEQDEEKQSTLLTINTRGISTVIHFFIFIFG